MTRAFASSLALLLVAACAHEDLAPTSTTSTPSAADPPPASAGASRPDPCGGFGSLRVDAPHEVLGGRFVLRTLADTRLVEPPARFTRGPGSAVRFSEFAMVRGDDALVVHVTEAMIGWSPELATRAGEAETARLGAHVIAPIGATSGIEGFVAYADGSSPSERAAIPFATAYVRTPDGTAVTIELEAWLETARPSPRACRDVARAVLASLAPGAARLDLGGGTHEIGPYLTLDVPSGYAVESMRYTEMSSLLIERVRTFDGAPHRMRVTFTRHPTDHGGMPRERSGPYLGRTVSYRNLYGEGLERRSAVLRIPGREEYAETLIEVPTLEDVAPFVALAGRIRVHD